MLCFVTIYLFLNLKSVRKELDQSQKIVMSSIFNDLSVLLTLKKNDHKLSEVLVFENLYKNTEYIYTHYKYNDEFYYLAGTFMEEGIGDRIELNDSDYTKFFSFYTDNETAQNEYRRLKSLTGDFLKKVDEQNEIWNN